MSPTVPSAPRPRRARLTWPPGGGSQPLRLVAGYFLLSGALSAAGLLTGLALAAFGSGRTATLVRGQFEARPAALAIRVVSILGWIGAGCLLSAGRRWGGVLALALLTIPAVSMFAGVPVHRLSLAISALGAVFVLRAWRELA